MVRSAITVASRKIGDKWNGAVIVNDAFALSLIETDLETLMQKALLGIFVDRPEGTVVTLNVVTTPPVDEGSATKSVV
jgi:hypothetical protein